MRVKNLSLANYRNYNQLTVELNPGINLFIGKNGQGKTNLVEAIRYCSTLSSHRSPNNTLISADQNQALIGVEIENNGKSLKLGVELNREAANRHSLNGNIVRKSSEILGALTTVIFSPEDIDIIRRDPATRRSFLNDLGVQLRPSYYQTLQDYERVLKQRNALLKSARGKSNIDFSTLELWDEKLISLGSSIIKNRESVLDSLLPKIIEKYQQISSSGADIQIKQVSSFDIDYSDQQISEITEHFVGAVKNIRQEELDRGITLIGPQRDEIEIKLNGLVSKEHASQGEAWSLALSMKLASAELIAESSSTGKPVMILDDVFSVLDSSRRQSLTQFVTGYEQVLITAAVEADVPLTSDITKYVIRGGQLE